MCFFLLSLSLFLFSILSIWRKIINHFACWLVTQIKVDINTHTQQMHWLWKFRPLLQPHQRYGRKRQWLFTWKIDDASALPLTFLSWVLSRSIFFAAAFTLLFTRNAQWIFSGEHQRKIGVPRHGKWLTFYDGFLLMFFTLCFLPWTTFEHLVWGGFFKNSLVVTTSFFLALVSWEITREIKCKWLINFFYSRHLSTRSFRLSFIIFYTLDALTLMP